MRIKKFMKIKEIFVENDGNPCKNQKIKKQKLGNYENHENLRKFTLESNENN